MPIQRPSDRDYPCFVCGGGTSKRKQDSCSACGQPLDAGYLFEGVMIEDYKLIRSAGRGFYGLTFLAENKIGKSFALKLIPARLYRKQAKSFDQEVKKYALLGSHPNIA